jgi:hypothetical protein
MCLWLIGTNRQSAISQSSIANQPIVTLQSPTDNGKILISRAAVQVYYIPMTRTTIVVRGPWSVVRGPWSVVRGPSLVVRRSEFAPQAVGPTFQVGRRLVICESRETTDRFGPVIRVGM